MRKPGNLARLLAVLVVGPCGVCFAEPDVAPAQAPPPAPAQPLAPAQPPAPPSESEKLFLDRLMMAESGGRLYAKNPATSAYGPFQFLRETFLDVVRRNFPELAAGKTDAEILALRANLEVARSAALVYTRENASFLAAHGSPASAANLRLAFFAGAAGAQRVLAAKPEEALTNILGASAIAANPFLGRMTAAALIEKSSREAAGAVRFSSAAQLSSAAQAAKIASPKVDVRCNLKLASCRHWLALAERRMGRRRVVLGPAVGKTRPDATD
jgi:hypothetical protein